MKLVEQSFKIYNSENVFKDIEFAARVCYQSFDSISEDNSSALVMVKNLIARKHYAMLEFGENIIMEIQRELLDELIAFSHEPFFKRFNISISNTRVLISFNPRTAIEFLEYVDSYPTEDSIRLKAFVSGVYNALPPVFTEHIIKKYENFPASTLFTKKINQNNLVSKLERDTHFFVTVNFTTNRGISHELVRHRDCSFAERSTRYVEDKEDMVFINPSFDHNMSAFKSQLLVIETYYKSLREMGWQKQSAREILPNALKTQIVVKANLREWKHIFELRCAKSAHPLMQALMLPCKAEFEQLQYIYG